jgi:putative alpha-1,2-mannosidase
MVRTSLTVVALAAPLVSAANVFQFVNEFIGTASGANGGSGGNAFPGAAIPHGMAKVSAGHLLVILVLMEVIPGGYRC